MATRLARVAPDEAAADFARFEAEVLMANKAMLKVFQRCGLPLRSRIEDGVVHVVMDLDAAAPPAPAVYP